MKIKIVAVGKLRRPEIELCDEYIKRMKGRIIVKEILAPKSLPPKDEIRIEGQSILRTISAKNYVILLDERGKNLSSLELSSRIVDWRAQGVSDLMFLIGGANGVAEEVVLRANFKLSFGRSTWPHRLVRVMLLEQLYRAHQIEIGHPYHREG